MVMTPQQARMKAMQLRSLKPELQNMAIEDLVAQVMASEGAEAPGAGGMPPISGLANLFPTRLTAASPAPMQPARLEAPKPTAQIAPVANANKSPNPLSWMESGVTSGYGKRASGMHQGVDYATPKGTPVGTPAPGVVVTAKTDNINGNYVVVKHPNGKTTSYSHLSGFNVKEGQPVDAGDILGTSGNTGRVRGKNGGYHLHVGARDEKNNRIDPRSILKDPSSLGVAPARESAIAAAGAPTASTATPRSTPAPVAAMAPPKGAPSRFRLQLEQKQSELEQLRASIPPGKEPSDEQASKLRNLSGVVTRLQGMVKAEEGAVVDADRAALLERQTARLAREEELADKAAKRAPFDALIAGGAALASARPGESFTSAFTRGLAAGNESYTGARDAREAARRGIEEKRDAYTLQKIDALQAARDRAIALQDAGAQLSKDEYALTTLESDDIVKLATQDDVISEAKSRASEAKTKADRAGDVIDSEVALRLAQKIYYESGGGRSDGGDKPMTANQIQTKIGNLSKERRGLMIQLNTATTVGPEKAAIRLAIKYIDKELEALRGGSLPAAPAAQAAPAKGNPPVKGAQYSNTTKKWYVPDPKRPGKYLEVTR